MIIELKNWISEGIIIVNQFAILILITNQTEQFDHNW